MKLPITGFVPVTVTHAAQVDKILEFGIQFLYLLANFSRSNSAAFVSVQMTTKLGYPLTPQITDLAVSCYSKPEPRQSFEPEPHKSFEG